MRSLDRIFSSSRHSQSDDIQQRLRGLPGESQAPYDWLEFRRRARSRVRPARSAVKWEHAAAAAGVTVLVASMAMWGSVNHPATEVSSSGITTVPSTTSNAPAAASAPSIADSGADTDVGVDVKEGSHVAANTPSQPAESAMSAAVQAAVVSQLASFARTQASRRWLDTQPAEPILARMDSRLAVANLEDRIAWVDDALTEGHFAQMNAARMQTLQQQRARLVTSLAQVRYAETLVAQVP